MVKIRICPKCKKPTLRLAFNVSGWLAPDMYECDCGYAGPVYIEIDSEDLSKIDEEELKKKKEE